MSKKCKHKHTFIQLDITEFYPSITEKVLEDAIWFALKHTQLTESELGTIKNCFTIKQVFVVR